MYTKNMLFFVLLFASFSLHAQSIQQRDTIPAVDYDSLQLKQKDQVYNYVGKMPEFTGGDIGFASYVSKNLKYPDEARKQRIQGSVYISFIIDTNGNVINAEVFRSLHPLLDKAALDVIMASPRWIPGENNGVPVMVRKIQPIKFQLK